MGLNKNIISVSGFYCMPFHKIIAWHFSVTRQIPEKKILNETRKNINKKVTKQIYRFFVWYNAIGMIRGLIWKMSFYNLYLLYHFIFFNYVLCCIVCCPNNYKVAFQNHHWHIPLFKFHHLTNRYHWTVFSPLWGHIIVHFRCIIRLFKDNFSFQIYCQLPVNIRPRNSALWLIIHLIWTRPRNNWY